MNPMALLQDFRAEASEHLRTLEMQLLRLERDAADRQAVDQMFRSAHTIKGGAGLVGLTDVLELAHAMEDTLANVRDRGHLDRDIADLLFRAIDSLRDRCGRALPGISEADRVREDLVAALRRRPEAAARPVPPAEASPNPPQRRVLLVDDSATVRLMTTMLLSEAGFEVNAVADGRLALAEALATRYELVVTSFETAGLSGLDLVAALRDAPSCRDVPVIVTSSGEDPEQRRRASALGVRACLNKGSLNDTQLVETALRLVASSATVSSAVEQPVSAPEPNALQLTRTCGLLVVEDSPLHQRVVGDLIKTLGYEADIVSTGRQALEALSRAEYGVVLMDCHMPELDGFETTREIRRREASTQHTPIIAMTADARPEDRDHCLATGMDEYLAKPVRKDELAACLARWTPPADDVLTATAILDAAMQSDAEAAAEDAPPAIDTHALHSLRSLAQPGLPDPVLPLIELFCDETRTRLADCRQALEQHQPEALAAAAHALKGNSGTFGATELHTLAVELERHARAGTLAGTQDLIASLEQEFTRVCGALEAFTAAHREGARNGR
jgi:CheY-like chemotaxis protein